MSARAPIESKEARRAQRKALVEIMRIWDGYDPEDEESVASALQSIGVALGEAGLAAHGTLTESAVRLAQKVEGGQS